MTTGGWKCVVCSAPSLAMTCVEISGTSISISNTTEESAPFFVTG